MKFHCDLCEYSTEDRSNFQKHERSEKHLINLKEKQNNDKKNKEIACLNCNRTFSQPSSFHRHKKNCDKDTIVQLKQDYKEKLKSYEEKIKITEFEYKDKIQKYEIELVALKTENAALKDKVIDNKEMFKIIVGENDYHKDLVNNAGTIVKTSVNALSYVASNYKEAPAIEKFSNFEILNKDKKYELYEVVMFYFEQNNIGKFFGENIVHIYKKDDPCQQSIWNSDTTRYAYMIREIINEKTTWSLDKGGHKVREYAVYPILQHVKKDLNGFVAKMSLKLLDPNANFEKIQKQILLAHKIIEQIDNGTICQEIMKYISPFFFLNKGSKKLLTN